MKTTDAAAAIAAILAQLPAGADLEAVADRAVRRAQYARDLKVARADWATVNEERAEEGEPAFTFREYLEYAREAGEWAHAIPQDA